MSDYIPYPEIDNKSFQEKIFHKKEFYDTKPEKLPRPDNQSDETVLKLFPRGKDFRLQSGQKFLRNFLSEATPYNGILVYHGTGTGKTCVAISIAERFHSRVDKTGKKILLVVNKSIQNEFYKTIFNLEKEETKKHKQVVQCTGRTYKLGKDSKYLSQTQKEKHIKNMINDVYEIIGRDKLRNTVIKETGWDGNEETLNQSFIDKIKELYSNRVIIIDEAHNRAQTADKDHKFPSTLKVIIRSSENTKLILMSATPMVNRPSDILILLNLLRLNDNKPFIKNSSIFKGDGTLVKGGKELLKEISKGYVSYIRGGETPRFPYKVVPTEAVIPTPKYLFNGDKIPENEKITHTKIIKCYMDIYQFNTYYQVLQSDLKSKIGGILPGTTQSSIIVFPTKEMFGTYGSSGFSSVRNNEHSLLITKDSFGNNIYQYSDFSSGFLLRKNIGKYSTKFASIFDNIINSIGISFVSSQYVKAGIIPLSLILEENGFEPAIITGKEKPLLKSKTKKPPICYLCGKPKHSTTDHKWYSAKYVVLTGDENLSMDEMAKISGYINRKENMDGKLVKVLLGSSVAGEGIDFKRIRQVHIVEAWYNQAKIDQITGRAIRNGSHKDLPPEKRNVEIFKYCAVPPQKLKAKERDIESIDEHNYRISEDKDKKIKDIEMIMKEVAVDCMFQRDNNIRNINRTIKLENSRGKIINYVTGDKEYSRECNYSKTCTYKCDWEPKNTEDININKSTYGVEFVETDIENVINVLYYIYKKDTIVDVDTIFEIIRSVYPYIDDVYVYLALEKLMDKNNIYSLRDKYQRNGYLVERGNLYIYQPENLDNKEAPVIYKETPIKSKPTDIAFSETGFKEELNMEKEVQKSGDNVFDNIFNYYTMLHNNIDKLINNKPVYVLDIILDMTLYKLSDINSIRLLKYITSPLYKKNENKEKEVFKTMIEKYYIDNKNIYKKDINLAIMIGPYSYQWDRTKHGSKKKKTNDWGMCDINIEFNMQTKIKNMINSSMLDKISLTEITENGITQSNYLSIIAKENLRPPYIATLDSKNATVNKQLKIFDFITYTNSNKDISKRKELRGRVCTTITIPDLKKIKINLLKEVEKISNIEIINQNGRKIPRPDICIQIEFLLRLLNEKTKLKWFFKGNFKSDDV